jgi:hypothetical protein
MDSLLIREEWIDFSMVVRDTIAITFHIRFLNYEKARSVFNYGAALHTQAC